jgi:CRP-like cAMP-binding protein
MPEENNSIDTTVLGFLQCQAGGTAYFISNNICYSRVYVSKSLQRMKRRGLVTNSGSYWKAVDGKAPTQ